MPIYYGANAFMKSIVPAAGLILIWLLIKPLVIDGNVGQMIPDSDIREGASRGLVMAEVTSVLKEAGQVVTGEITPTILQAAQSYRAQNATSDTIMTVVAILLALAGAAWGVLQAAPLFRARNVVEQGVLALLIAARQYVDFLHAVPCVRILPPA